MQSTRIRFFAAMLCIAMLALCACGRPAAPEETAAAPTLPIVPASYRDAPEAYWPVLDDLRKWIFVVDNYRDFHPWEDWGINPGIHMISESAVSREYAGYAIRDINNDGTPELLILNSSADDELCPLALFTLQDNAPIPIITARLAASRRTVSYTFTMHWAAAATCVLTSWTPARPR